MPIIFGYGSLMNTTSISRTLGRCVTHQDFFHGVLPEYVRTWTASTNIQVKLENQLQCYRALFLDLTPVSGHYCNGVCLEVTDHEMALLDKREQQYERCTITLDSDLGNQRAYTYIVPASDKQYHGLIPVCYVDMLHEALANYPPEFASIFWKTTRHSNARMLDGNYIFTDCRQNRAAGRQLDAYPESNQSVIKTPDNP